MNQPKINAYAILAGGGVKGAALAGALQAAEEVGIDFLGYGGCSAGSLVALLAALRYSNDEIREIVVDTDFRSFLDDSGKDLRRLLTLVARMESSRGLPGAALKGWHCLRHWRLIRRLRDRFGLYHGEKLQRFVEEKIRQKVPQLGQLRAVNFSHLSRYNCKPLKVIVSNLQLREAVVYSSEERDDQVSHAIRASIGFPFVFEPLHFNGHQLVDGGLASNLPVDLFDGEGEGAQVIAFDLRSRNAKLANDRRFWGYCGDLLATALEAGDTFYRKSRNICYIPIKIPKGIGTLDFALSTEQRQQLWDEGHNQAYFQLSETFRNGPKARPPVEAYQPAPIVPVDSVRPVLQALVTEVISAQTATELRSYVFLREDLGSLRLVAHLDRHGTSAPQLRLDSASRSPVWKVLERKRPQLADFATWEVKSARQLPEFWSGRRSFFGVPLFALSERTPSAAREEEDPVFGVVGLDASEPLDETNWHSPETFEKLYEIMNPWARILARLLQR